MPGHELDPRSRLQSLAYATDIDVLPQDAIVADHRAYVAVQTPSVPTFYWGNFVLFREPPTEGSRERWEADFERTFGERRHRAFGWDRVDGAVGHAEAEFVSAGYDLDVSVALVATDADLAPHPRANRDVVVRRLDPAPGADERAWAEVVELQVAGREDGHDEPSYRRFVGDRQAATRGRLHVGDGAWFVAELDGRVVATCGVIVTAGRGRYQTVETLESVRRRGIASRLVHDAGRIALTELGADVLVIVADADYHALPLYESLGFAATERVCGVCWWPGAPNASRHPVLGQLAGETPSKG